MTEQLGDEWSLETFLTTIHEGNVGLWSWDPESRTARLDSLSQRFWGIAEGAEDAEGEGYPLEDLFARILEEDREGARRAWLDSARTEAPYEFEFRVPRGEAGPRWLSARGIGGDNGRRGAGVLAVFVDVTAVKEEQEAKRLLVREMHHRLANLFAVAGSLATLSARGADSAASLAEDLRTRFSLLRSAFAYALGEEQDGKVPLKDAVTHLIAPYRQPGESLTITIPGDLHLSGAALTNMTLILHEMATNAVKYGALQAPDGRLYIEATREGEAVHLVWREEVRSAARAETGRGFGSTLIDKTVQSLGGSFERRVGTEATTIHLSVPDHHFA